MEPLAALSVASNIIQLVDFSSRIISRGHELYQSIDGRTEDHAILDKAAENLAELYNDLKKSAKSSSGDFSSAEKQLLNLKVESETVVQNLRQTLDNARLKNKHKRWQSIYHALKSVHSDKEIANLAARLDSIRKQVDSALLMSLRQRLDLLISQPSDSVNMPELLGENQRAKVLLQDVSKNNWQPSQANDMNAFSERLQENTAADLETHFHKAILSRLYFQHMPDRSESIPSAYVDTFQWLFADKDNQNKSTPSNSFKNWLRRDNDNIYWITGKPGSGKSTLMKFIYGHSDLDASLRAWVSSKVICKSGFYFWNSGGFMQMSRLGLLQTLLYTCLCFHTDLILSAFPERWEQFVAFGGGRDSISWPELKRAFKIIISNRSRKFFFLIDGLDEFEGEPKELVDMVLGAAANPNVKFCIASRPWLPFEDAFKRRPNLRLEDLTREDISIYVAGHFQTNEHYLRLKQEDLKGARAIIQDIADRASGVFLWAYLVVQSLLEGLSNSDRMSDLQERLDALPSDLEALFDKLLFRLEPRYFKQACQIFRLLRAYRDLDHDRHAMLKQSSGPKTPSLLEMYYADDDNTSSSLHAPSNKLHFLDAQRKAEDMRRRLIARCKGFLDILNPHAKRFLFDHEVSYLHRTARDYVESERYWQIVLESTENYYPERRCANASLWMRKVHPYKNFDHRSWSILQCLGNAICLQEQTGIVQRSYLDEVFSNPRTLMSVSYPLNTAIFHHHYNTYKLGYYMLLVLDGANSSEQKLIIAHFRKVYKTWKTQRCPDEFLMKHMKYYISSRWVRWLRQRPALPRYE